MTTVPPPCAHLAENVAAIAAREASVHAGLAHLRGAEAWAALLQLGRLRRELRVAREALDACVRAEAGSVVGQLVIFDLSGDVSGAAGPSATRTVELWEVDPAGHVQARQESPVLGEYFSLHRPLPARLAMTVTTVEMPSVPASSQAVRDFRSPPVEAANLPADGPLRIEVVLGPHLSITTAQLNAWLATTTATIGPVSLGAAGTLTPRVTGVRVSLPDGRIRAEVDGSYDVTGGPIPATGLFSAVQTFGVQTSAAPVGDVCEVHAVGPPAIHLPGPVAAIASLLSSTIGEFVADLLTKQVRAIMLREVPLALARVLALNRLPDGLSLTIRRLTVGPEAVAFQPTLGAVGRAISTFTPPAVAALGS